MLNSSDSLNGIASTQAWCVAHSPEPGPDGAAFCLFAEPQAGLVSDEAFLSFRLQRCGVGAGGAFLGTAVAALVQTELCFHACTVAVAATSCNSKAA